MTGAAPSPASRATPKAAVGEADPDLLLRVAQAAEGPWDRTGHHSPEELARLRGIRWEFLSANEKATRISEARASVAVLSAETAQLRAQLAACEAREAGLREALIRVDGALGDQFPGGPVQPDHKDRLGDVDGAWLQVRHVLAAQGSAS